MRKTRAFILGKVDGDVWDVMRDIARELDIDEGGLYDARMGAINIWCSPEDKPKGWDKPITRGALRYPREYVATIYAYRLKDGNFFLTLSVEDPSPTIVEWALQKAWNLIENARREQFAKPVVTCPYCGQRFPNLKLFNEFLAHLSRHVKIRSVFLRKDGIHVVTEHGLIAPKDYVKYELRR